MTLALQNDALTQQFPFDQARPTQERAFELISEHPEGVLLEIPTGEGKTAIGITTARAMKALGERPLHYVTPTKAQVEQIHRLHPADTIVIYGRAEYPCLYYTERDKAVTAEESPCYMLKCPHRVNQDTGETEVPEAVPCPYFEAKFLALEAAARGTMVVSTTAFFLTNRLLVERWQRTEPALIVLDEAHRLAKTTRGIFQYQISDHLLRRSEDVVRGISPELAGILRQFRLAFMRIARRRPSRTPSLLKDEEIERLLGILETVDVSALEKSVQVAVESGQIDAVEEQETLKLLENLIRNIPRFVRSFRYATEGEDHRPLNYVIVTYYQEDDPEFEGTAKKARYFLSIKAYYVAPLIRRIMGGSRIVAFSATIGDPGIFAFETGLRLHAESLVSSFPSDNARVYMPSDTPDLSFRKLRKNTIAKTLGAVAAKVAELGARGLRCLVVVVSEKERAKFIQLAEGMGLEVISYGNGVPAKQAARKFIEGEGTCLVGTAAQYAEGIDLPRGIAPVIFFLRPGYQRPDDPEAQFEERRFTQGRVWALRNWRVMMEALQVRGRNIRANEDLGVTIFVSQQFRRFLYPALPEWLKTAYNGTLTLDEAVADAIEFLT